MSGRLAARAAGDGEGTLWDRASPVGRLLGALDDAGDALVAPLRGRPAADACAAAVSNLSDYGLLWVACAALKAARGPRRRRAVVALAGAGVTSYLVNRAAKRLAGRDRPGPAAAGSGALPVRRPSSSSFPSGHVLAAFCTALVLPDSPAGTAAGLGFASAVALSRVHLRAHHASDVVAGALIGTAAGLCVRPLVDAVGGREGPGAPRAPGPRRRME